ncbi:NAD(P)-dependent oxidoreductase [Gloeocapsopsis sp. IPPAS B-1203]|uniref:NAD-dependent epimerase/dehydratase family protein n=1 Tax=Gloeocapsopsis sp. IPPAS B-1203 TaxID=2049454 RepID=UPI000C1A3042|nr:NAD(P)-dependent oxidoreductase [Gloeocapsopsis sp. IPPAS B-1203]PIG93549.1 NAD-dependent dehydratase [Gloeocapsopsis sp. IPPAS B-1203]
MKVLVTGSEGMIGAVVMQVLQDDGNKVVGFDIVNSQDILKPDQLQIAIQGCDAVVHLAASLGFAEDTANDIMTVNLLGTWHVLTAAAKAKVKRVVFFSSVDALGVFKGERKPDYLPLDDNHLCYPATPYAISKRLSEEMCRFWRDSTGIPTICLRPPGVFDAATYDFIISNRNANPDFEWNPFWEYGAFLDVRDAAEAAKCALSCSFSGHVTLLLCADDISSASRTSREMAQSLHPDVEWRGGKEYDQQPYKALINTHRAKEVLNWIPRYKWRP